MGQNKRVAEELAAQKALTMLQHLQVITESGKLNTGVLNPAKENHYSSQSHQAGQIFSDEEIATKDGNEVFIILDLYNLNLGKSRIVRNRAVVSNTKECPQYFLCASAVSHEKYRPKS